MMTILSNLYVESPTPLILVVKARKEIAQKRRCDARKYS